MIDDSEIVCECLKIDAKEIREVISNGAKSLDAISEACEAGSACTRCLSYENDKALRRKYHIKEDFLDI